MAKKDQEQDKNTHQGDETLLVRANSAKDTLGFDASLLCTVRNASTLH